MAAPLVEKHLHAIELRKEGKSYSQIKRELQVSKSSLSLWLRRYPLSTDRLIQLRDRNEKRIENFRETFRKKRCDRLGQVYKREKAALLPLNRRELLIAGLFLYWGEGTKTGVSTVSVSNTNPKIVKFFLYWVTEILGISREKVWVRLHVYADMDIKAEIEFWRKELALPLNSFKKPYVKKTTLRGLTFKSFGHGTCNVIFYGRDVLERILMGIEAIADCYSAKFDIMR